MNILHLQHSVYPQTAGYRIHKALLDMGINSKYFVQYKYVDDTSVITDSRKRSRPINYLKSGLDQIPLKFYPKYNHSYFSPAIAPDNLISQLQSISLDIVNLHWICGGFIRIESLKKITHPLVWTLYDSWPFTGGCHIPYECEGYIKKCGKCPILKSSSEFDLSHWIWKRKMASWKDLNLTIVASSHWMEKSVRSSSLFHNCRIDVIPTGIDTNQFTPTSKDIARSNVSLPINKKIILFGAVNCTTTYNKGFHLLKKALKKLNGVLNKKETEIIIFGGDPPAESQDIGFKITYLGKIDDATLAQLYRSADVFVAPSLSDNLPNTVMEALSSGTPCVAFQIGGMPDMIDHLKNGYLARPFDPDDLAKGIEWILSDENRWQSLSKNARQKILREFDIIIIAKKYSTLYNEILN